MLALWLGKGVPAVIRGGGGLFHDPFCLRRAALNKRKSALRAPIFSCPSLLQASLQSAVQKKCPLRGFFFCSAEKKGVPAVIRGGGPSIQIQMPGLRPSAFFIPVALESELSTLHP
jgi:hypothetical protein